MLGMPAPADIRTLTAAADELGATTPFLLVHSALDPLVPFAAAEAFAAAHPEHVELARFETAGHTLEANAAPERFAAVITGWLERVSRASRPV